MTALGTVELIATIRIITLNANAVYVWSFKHSVPIMLSVVMLYVDMLSDVVLSVVAL
jgi:hypothetical protein